MSPSGAAAERKGDLSDGGGVMKGPKGPQHKPKRAPEQGAVPARASAESLLTVSDGKSFQQSNSVSWRGLFCLSGVKKMNRASMTPDNGTWCNQELLHI